MTVNTEVNRKDHNPDGIENTFVYDFRVDYAGDMVVYADGVLYAGSFTMTGLGDAAGGTVIFDSVPPGTITTLTLYRLVDATQLLIYPRYNPFPSATHEKALDKLTWLYQQLREQQNRGLIAPIDDSGVSYELPPYAAGEFWKWDAITQELVTTTLVDLGILSVGVAIGDVVELINVGGSAGFPVLVGDNLTVGGDTVAEAATKTVDEIGATFAASSACFPVGFETHCSSANLWDNWLERDGSARQIKVYLLLHNYLDGMYGLNAGQTFTTAFATNTINEAAHGYLDDEMIRMTNSGGGLPTGYAEGTDYYIIDSETNSYKVSLSEGGEAVEITDDGTGTHSSHDEFLLMDDRGLHDRGRDNGAGVDLKAASRTDRGDGTTGDAEGTLQAPESESHVHAGIPNRANPYTYGGVSGSNANSTATTNSSPYGGLENTVANRSKIPVIYVGEG